MRFWHHYHYKNLTFLLFSILFAILISRFELFHTFLLNLGDWGYVGAFIAGILFVSTFTVTTGAVILLILAERLSLIEISLLAGLGGVLGDLFIYKLIKDNLITEIEPIYESLGGNHLTKLLRTKYFSWFLPVLGALIIASPFPDELGVSLLGFSKMKTYQFLLLAFVLDAIGVALIVSASAFIKP
jgi:hypothetical protein